MKLINHWLKSIFIYAKCQNSLLPTHTIPYLLIKIELQSITLYVKNLKTKLQTLYSCLKDS
jgi:hypothetical protein